jgi:hypothetical protein
MTARKQKLITQYWAQWEDPAVMPTDKPVIALFALIHDLSDRRGIGDEWDALDDDIREEILQKWLKIIEP